MKKGNGMNIGMWILIAILVALAIYALFRG